MIGHVHSFRKNVATNITTGPKKSHYRQAALEQSLWNEKSERDRTEVKASQVKTYRNIQ